MEELRTECILCGSWYKQQEVKHSTEWTLEHLLIFYPLDFCFLATTVFGLPMDSMPLLHIYYIVSNLLIHRMHGTILKGWSYKTRRV